MHKLIQGMFAFQKRLSASKRAELSRLALGQRPDAFMIACCDSRVAPNAFASTQPGDLYVPRVPGNLVPRFQRPRKSDSPDPVGAAIEHAVVVLRVKHMIVCGHSECGLMMEAANHTLSPQARKKMPIFRQYLGQVAPSLRSLAENPGFAHQWAPHNRLSQWSVIQQLDNLRTHRCVDEAVRSNRLQLHGWFFDLHEWQVLGLAPERDRFTAIDHEYVEANGL